MKKKPGFWIIIGIVVVIAAVAIVMGKQYYDDRYVGKPYYAVVPQGYDITPTMIKSDSGADISPGVKFNLVAYDAQGEAREVEFIVFAPEDTSVSRETMPKPGDYLEINASKTIVVGWGFTTEGAIPQNALAKLQG